MFFVALFFVALFFVARVGWGGGLMCTVTQGLNYYSHYYLRFRCGVPVYAPYHRDGVIGTDMSYPLVLHRHHRGIV